MYLDTSSNTTNTFTNLYNADNLWAAYYNARKATGYKENVQRFGINLLQNIHELQSEIRSGKYHCIPQKEFTISERGHKRFITSLTTKDRVVQRSLNDYIVTPKIAPKLIYDNSASQVNKGQSFALKRFKIMLNKAYRQYGKDAYVLQIDFRKYFDNLRHDVIKGQFASMFADDKRTLQFIYDRIDEFRPNVSYMTNEEYSNAMDHVYSSLERPAHIPDGNRFLAKAAPIGNQLSQNIGIYYPHRIDNYCKIVLGLKFYARYMDDTVIILPDKKTAQRVYMLIGRQCKALGLFINRKKSKICKISEPIRFLKIIHRVTNTGKVYQFVAGETFRRERRKLRKFKSLLERGEMTLAHIELCFKGWLGMYASYDSKGKIYGMRQYFKEVFSKWIIGESRKSINKSAI